MKRSDHVLTKLERARELYLALHAEVVEFLAGNNYSVYVDDEKDEEGFTVLRLRVEQDPPVRWAAIVGDIVHNLRSCLDVAVYQLVEENGEKPSTSTSYPMSESANAYSESVGRRTQGIANEARKVIDESRPYRGGDDSLYLLHRLGIEDKHHLLLALSSSAEQGISVSKPMVPFEGARFVPGIQMMPRRFSSHLFPLSDGAMLMRTDRTVTDPAALMRNFVFMPMIALKPDGRDYDDIFAILSPIAATTEALVKKLLPFFVGKEAAV